MHAYTGNVTVLEHNILQKANGKRQTSIDGYTVFGIFSVAVWMNMFVLKIVQMKIHLFMNYTNVCLIRVLSWLKQESKKSWRYIRDKNIVEIHMIKTNVAHIHIRVKGWRKSSNLKMECIYSKYFLTVAQQVFFTDIQMPLNLLLQKMQKIHG